MTVLREIISEIPGLEVSGDINVQISSITYDSRSVTPGSMFVALKGGYADGHQFLSDALSRGAVAAAVCEQSFFDTDFGFQAMVLVPDTRSALARFSSRFYGSPSEKLKLIGVTGTDGKTSTTYFIEHMLRSASISTGLIGTIAIRIANLPDHPANRQTTPESLEVQRYLASMVEHGVEVAILESTSHGLEMHRLDECAFDIGVVTNITHEHLDFHGSVEAYRAAKAKLLKKVRAAKRAGGLGVVVLNADDPGTMEIAEVAGDCNVIWFSTKGHPRAMVQAKNQLHHRTGSRFDLEIAGEAVPVKLRIPGSWNVSNALAAAGAGLALELPLPVIAEGLSGLSVISGRMESVTAGQPFTVIVDYAHTPESLLAVLSEARELSENRVLVLFGSAGERDVEKRSMQGKLAVELADFAVFTSEDPRFEDPLTIIEDIAEGAMQAGWRRNVDFVCVEDRRTATYEILRNALPGDVVVLAGKGHERSIIYEDRKRYWNEIDEVRSALASLGYPGNLNSQRKTD